MRIFRLREGGRVLELVQSLVLFEESERRRERGECVETQKFASEVKKRW